MVLDRIDALAGRATLWLVRAGALVLAVMMLMTFFDVIGRYFLNQPIVGTVDMTELYMGLIVFLGIGATTLKRGHISVDIVVSRLRPRARLLSDLFAQAVCAVLAVLICWQLWVVAQDTFANHIVTRVWETPVYPVAYAMAAASVLMVVALLLQVVQTLVALTGGRGT